MSAAICYVVAASSTSELLVWLKCNDVDPADVPYPSKVFVESDELGCWSIRYPVYARTRSGSVVYDRATSTYACEIRRTELLNDPPMEWLKEYAEEAPTGEGASSGPGTSASVAGEENVTEGACNWD